MIFLFSSLLCVPVLRETDALCVFSIFCTVCRIGSPRVSRSIKALLLCSAVALLSHSPVLREEHCILLS